MANPPILCLGEALFDLLAENAGKSLEEVSCWLPYPGGAPANVACALQKLGTPAGFIGCVGTDMAGSQLTLMLQSLGVNTLGLQLHGTAPTRRIYVLRDFDGERFFAGFGEYRADEFADAFLDASFLPISLFEEADFLVIGTLSLAYPLSREAVFQALELANLYHLKIVVDINWRPNFWLNIDDAKSLINQLWEYVDFVKFSAEEANWLFNTEDAGKISYLLDSVEGVIITNGGKGDINYCINDYQGKVKPFNVNSIDNLGAGDAFLAGFIHQLYHRKISCLNEPKQIEEIITYAAAVGALTTLKKGAIHSQPSSEEVDKFLKI